MDEQAKQAEFKNEMIPGLIPKIDVILARGLSKGIGEQGKQVCVEAAICEALGLPHGDDPGCVEPAVRSFKIRLNDARWSSPRARAKGMRDLAIAQLGSKGVVDGREFAKRMAEKTIRVVLPEMVQAVKKLREDKKVVELAEKCRAEGTREAARGLRDKLYKIRNADAAAAAYADADAAAAAYAAYADADAYTAAAAAADAAAAAAAAVKGKAKDKFLLLSAKLALETLQELKSPGCEYL